MTTHILFRFHKDFDVCAQSLHLLRRMNPGMPIHGMYGGFGGLESLPAELTTMMDTVWAIPFEDPAYNWKNGDLCLRWWFKDFGYAQDFTHLAVVEWDLLYLKSMADAYGPLQPDTIQMSLVDGYKNLLDEKWPWIQGSYKWQVDALLEKLEDEGRPVDIESLTFGVMGGCVICRKFLELYAKETVCSYSNDEVRMAIYARLFGIPFVDNGFCDPKHSMFDASVPSDGEGLTIADIKRVMADGAKAVHPIRQLIDGLVQAVTDE